MEWVLLARLMVTLNAQFLLNPLGGFLTLGKEEDPSRVKHHGKDPWNNS